MTVYVDELRHANPTSARVARAGMRHGHLWCHMMADTGEELHAFAAKLKMPREWYHGDHYDLTPTRRVQAMDLGAMRCDSRFLVELRRKARQQDCCRCGEPAAPQLLTRLDGYELRICKDGLCKRPWLPIEVRNPSLMK